MKQFNLEEYLANPLRKVVTRDGRNVTIHCTNYIGAQHIIAQVEGKSYSSSFYEDGRYANDRDESHLDLFFAPEKHEGWVNLYKDIAGIYVLSQIYKTKESAEASSCITCIATVKIEWEE